MFRHLGAHAVRFSLTYLYPGPCNYDLRRTSGVYLFLDKLTHTVVQCGSCVNWTTRLALHYQVAGDWSENVPFSAPGKKGVNNTKPFYAPCTDSSVCDYF